MADVIEEKPSAVAAAKRMGGDGQEEEEEEEGEELVPLVRRSGILYCGGEYRGRQLKRRGACGRRQPCHSHNLFPLPFSVCSIPPEFCEYNPPELYADCLQWQAEHHPELLPEVSNSE